MTERQSVFLDTDIFGDPDDLFALIYLLGQAEIALEAVMTVDELKQLRARVLQGLFVQLNLSVSVFSGKDIGDGKYFVFEESQAEYLEPTSSFLSLIREKLAQAADRTTYLSIGPLTNLAELLDQLREQASQLKIIVMGGSFQPQFGRAEHNIRLDIPAAQRVALRSGIYWITADNSVSSKLQISQDHWWIQELNAQPGILAEILKQNVGRFHSRFYPNSYLHDPLVVSAALGKHMTFESKKVRLSDEGYFVEDETGVEHFFVKTIDYEGFLEDFRKAVMSKLKA
ncbi:MAG: nucleoside hydrolase [Patescibacteria group bacterium]